MDSRTDNIRRYDDGSIDFDRYRAAGAKLRRQARNQYLEGTFRRLLQIPAKALNALARFLEIFCLGRVGNAEGRAEAEGRPLHHRNSFRL